MEAKYLTIEVINFNDFAYPSEVQSTTIDEIIPDEATLDHDSRLDAKATLERMPKRALEIGEKIISGIRLVPAERTYIKRIRQKWVTIVPAKAGLGIRIPEITPAEIEQQLKKEATLDITRASDTAKLEVWRPRRLALLDNVGVKRQQTHIQHTIRSTEVVKLLTRLPQSLQGLTVVCGYCKGRFLFEDVITLPMRTYTLFSCLNCTQRMEIDVEGNQKIQFENRVVSAPPTNDYEEHILSNFTPIDVDLYAIPAPAEIVAMRKENMQRAKKSRTSVHEYWLLYLK